MLDVNPVNGLNELQIVRSMKCRHSGSLYMAENLVSVGFLEDLFPQLINSTLSNKGIPIASTFKFKSRSDAS